jgi:outer membrane protein assembly factor BamB
MSHVESALPIVASTRRSRRVWLPLSAIAVALVAIAVIWLFAPEQLDRVDRGTRLVISFLLALAAGLVVLTWFFLLGSFALVGRLLVALLLVTAATAFGLSIRRVEFSGDMVPTFDFRWSPDRTEVLEAHRTRQRSMQGASGLTPPAAELIERASRATDVLEYRGPRRDGVVEGPALARDWSASPPRLVWRQPVGGGYASFVVVGPLVITIEQRRDNEAIVAYDFDTGRERWIHEYPALFSEKLGGDGPRATPTIHDGKLYSLGATGVLVCLELATGRNLWSLNILEQNASGNLDWGMSGSPLVYDGLVLVNPGNQKGTADSRSIAAFDLAEGKPLWSNGTNKAGYASPMLATLSGLRQIIIFDATGLAGHDALDGRELWRTPWTSSHDINAAQPVILSNDRILISSSSGSALIQVSRDGDRWTADESWKTPKLKCGYANPIVYEDHVYGLDETILACLEVSSGKQRWKSRGGQYGHGQMLLCHDLLVVLAETGELALVDASPQAFRELGRIQAIEGKTWNNPVLVGPRIFVRNHLEMAAYDLPIVPKAGAAGDPPAQAADETTSNSPAASQP